ncbi:uncharacterized protein LDX57_008079 [Aspergillus melleus]|uniref:uncharacterized protein n=1 Tax=Aspergillus melleus TaxID=138277 RepID=UPI001E8E6C76|nr:uncharacterized protein LDX57_008079 [Aspergillus melleus]KAH8430417.1 hypothetical protein LDX57_008079 [Aspergillus melleus]
MYQLSPEWTGPTSTGRFFAPLSVSPYLFLSSLCARIETDLVDLEWSNRWKLSSGCTVLCIPCMSVIQCGSLSPPEEKKLDTSHLSHKLILLEGRNGSAEMPTQKQKHQQTSSPAREEKRGEEKLEEGKPRYTLYPLLEGMPCRVIEAIQTSITLRRRKRDPFPGEEVAAGARCW